MMRILSAVLAAAIVSPAMAGDAYTPPPAIGFAWRSGYWYQSPYVAAYTGSAQTASTLYCYAQPVPYGGRGVQALGSAFSAGNASNKIAWAFYLDAGGKPGVQIGRTAAVAQIASGFVSGSLTSGPFAIAPPGVWTCETQDTTSTLASVGDSNSNGAATQGTTTGSGATTLGIMVVGLSCALASACGGGGGAWAGGAVVLPSDLSSATWTVVFGSSHTVPTIAMQAQ